MDRVGGREKERVVARGQRGRWETLTDWARAQGAVILSPIVRALSSMGIHPNAITITGSILQTCVGVVFGLGYIRVAGWLLLAVAPIDALDGALARATGKQSRFGAFLDSTLDRLSDAAVILGLTAHYIRREDYVAVSLLLVALVSSLMVSYVRARAEAEGFQCKVGLLTRVERLALIGTLSAFGLSDYMAWALAVLSVITVVQRIVYVYLCSRRDGQIG
jgi:CDP-diacylglycerol--glycerol-3-phosphate 3-phosphatidyltransferase